MTTNPTLWLLYCTRFACNYTLLSILIHRYGINNTLTYTLYEWIIKLCTYMWWANKFCLHSNIFIYIRHIWIKPVLCSRIVSLFHHTSPWTHRCLQFSPSAHQNGRVFRCLVQTVCCYWILNCWKSSSNWNSQMNASRLWWSLCWCEYIKMQGKAVQKWRNGASRFEWQNAKWKDCDWKWSASSKSCWRTDPWKNNYAALKIIDVGIFLFLFH